MLLNARLSKKYRAEVVIHACHPINRLFEDANGRKTPFEKWPGTPLDDYDSLLNFGRPAYYHVQDDKLDPRAKKAKFLGFNSRVKRYRLWCIESRKIILSRDVTFNESEMLMPKASRLQ